MPPAAAKKSGPPDVAPPAFRRIWEWVLAHQGRRKREAMAKAAGFERSAWYDYQRLGTIPFNKLERLVNLLGGSIDAKVVTAGVSGVSRTGPSKAEDEEASEDIVTLEQLYERIQRLPPEQRGAVRGKLEMIVATEELAARNPSERVAEQKGHRGSSSR